MTIKAARSVLVGVCCGALGHAVLARTQSQPPVPDVSVAAPNEYHVEFENQYVRVARVKSPPHITVPLHSHPAPGGVIVTLTDQDSRVTGRDGTSREIHVKAGQARWAVSTPGADSSSASAHTEENLSDKPIELIRIDVKQSSPSQQPQLPNVAVPLDQLKWVKMPDGTGREPPICSVIGQSLNCSVIWLSGQRTRLRKHIRIQRTDTRWCCLARSTTVTVAASMQARWSGGRRALTLLSLPVIHTLVQRRTKRRSCIS